MAKFVRIITALLLVAHFTLGCCAHHGHACEASEPGSQQAEAAEHCCHGDEASSEPHQSQQDGHECQGDRCSVLLTVVPVGVASAGHSSAILAWTAVVPLPVPLNRSGRPVMSFGGVLPDRLYLAKRVLLI